MRETLEEPLFTIAEVSRALMLPDYIIRDWIKRKKLPSRFFANRVVIELSDLLFIAQNGYPPLGKNSGRWKHRNQFHVSPYDDPEKE